MKFKELKQEIKELQEKLHSANKIIYVRMEEIKELQEKLNSANRVIYRQMQEIQELNNVCEYNDKAHKRELERKDAVIEYLEGKI